MLSFRNTTLAATAPNKRHAKKDLPSGRQAAVSTEARKFLQKSRLILIASIIVCLLTRTVQSTDHQDDEKDVTAPQQPSEPDQAAKRLAGMSVQVDPDQAQKETLLEELKANRFALSDICVWHHSFVVASTGERNGKGYVRFDEQDDQDELSRKIRAEEYYQGNPLQVTIQILTSGDKRHNKLAETDETLQRKTGTKYLYSFNSIEKRSGTKRSIAENGELGAKAYPVYRISWYELSTDSKIYYALSALATENVRWKGVADISATVKRLAERDESIPTKLCIRKDAPSCEDIINIGRIGKKPRCSSWQRILATLDRLYKLEVNISKWDKVDAALKEGK